MREWLHNLMFLGALLITNWPSSMEVSNVLADSYSLICGTRWYSVFQPKINFLVTIDLILVLVTNMKFSVTWQLLAFGRWWRGFDGDRDQFLPLISAVAGLLLGSGSRKHIGPTRVRNKNKIIFEKLSLRSFLIIEPFILYRALISRKSGYRSIWSTP